MGDWIPRALAEAVNAAKFPCSAFASAKGCKRGDHCSLRHGDVARSAQVLTKLPHVTRQKLSDGSQVMVLRPPLREAFNVFFDDVPLNPIAKGEYWQANGRDYVTFFLVGMISADAASCSAARSSGGAQIGTASDSGQQIWSWQGQSTKEAAQLDCCVHVTDIAEALKVLSCGKIAASSGSAGTGIYVTPIDDLDNESLMAGWRDSANCLGGACFVLRNRGVVVNAKSSTILPPGTVGFKNKNNICVAGSTADYISVTFLVEGLVQALDKELFHHNYSYNLYKACQAVRQYMMEAQEAKKQDAASSSSSFFSEARAADSVRVVHKIVQRPTPPGCNNKLCYSFC